MKHHHWLSSLTVLGFICTSCISHVRADNLGYLNSLDDDEDRRSLFSTQENFGASVRQKLTDRDRDSSPKGQRRSSERPSSSHRTRYRSNLLDQSNQAVVVQNSEFNSRQQQQQNEVESLFDLGRGENDLQFKSQGHDPLQDVGAPIVRETGRRVNISPAGNTFSDLADLESPNGIGGYGQFSLSSNKNLTTVYGQKDDGKNTQIIINLHNSPKSYLYGSGDQNKGKEPGSSSSSSSDGVTTTTSSSGYNKPSYKPTTLVGRPPAPPVTGQGGRPIGPPAPPLETVGPPSPPLTTSGGSGAVIRPPSARFNFRNVDIDAQEEAAVVTGTGSSDLPGSGTGGSDHWKEYFHPRSSALSNLIASDIPEEDTFEADDAGEGPFRPNPFILTTSDRRQYGEPPAASSTFYVSLSPEQRVPTVDPVRVLFQTNGGSTSLFQAFQSSGSPQWSSAAAPRSPVPPPSPPSGTYGSLAPPPAPSAPPVSSSYGAPLAPPASPSVIDSYGSPLQEPLSSYYYQAPAAPLAPPAPPLAPPAASYGPPPPPAPPASPPARPTYQVTPPQDPAASYGAPPPPVPPASPARPAYEAPPAQVPAPSYGAPPPAPPASPAAYAAPPAQEPAATYGAPLAPPLAQTPPEAPAAEVTIIQPQGLSISIQPHPIRIKDQVATPSSDAAPKPSYLSADTSLPEGGSAASDPLNFTLGGPQGQSSVHYHVHLRDFDDLKQLNEVFSGQQSSKSSDEGRDPGPKPSYGPPRDPPSYNPPKDPPSYNPPSDPPSYNPPSDPPSCNPPKDPPSYNPPRDPPSYNPPRDPPSYNPPRDPPPSYDAPRDPPSYDAPRDPGLRDLTPPPPPRPSYAPRPPQAPPLIRSPLRQLKQKKFPFFKRPRAPPQALPQAPPPQGAPIVPFDGVYLNSKSQRPLIAGKSQKLKEILGLKCFIFCKFDQIEFANRRADPSTTDLT